MSDRSDFAALPDAGDAGSAGIDFEAVFDNAPCGYVLADKGGRITRANLTFCGWIGASPASLVGKRFSDVLSVASKMFYETHVRSMLDIQGSLNEIALDIACDDGNRIPMLVNARKDPASQGPSSTSFALFNATQRRGYERRLLDSRDTAQATVVSEKANSELREQFIAVLGHDLRNPLASIASGARMLQREGLSDRGRQILKLIDGSVLRAAGLIDNVLDFARGRLGGGITLTRDTREPLEPVLRQVVAELQSVSPERTIHATYAIDEPVDCDRTRMGQVLSNLLGNAVTHGAKDQPIRVAVMTVSGELVMTVANGGAPILPAALNKLFQPFFRGDRRNPQQGLGLGLHIASEIARAHGGDLVATSDAQETCFTFTMPVADPGLR